MKCLLIFDNLNDIIYLKCNKNFSKHVAKLAKAQGLMPDTQEEESPDLDVVLQLFSPLITSQRIMANHFSNAYSSIKCYDGLSFLFDEYMGYLFVCIGYDRNYWLRRQLGVFISIVKHICGPDVSALKSSEKKLKLLSYLMNAWYRLVNTEQSVLVEAIEQLRINSQTAASCLKALTEAAEKVKSNLSYSQVHALILVNHRFLSLYSTRTASELISSDILFLSLVGEVEQRNFEKECKPSIMAVYEDSSDSDGDSNDAGEYFYSPDDSRASDTMSVKSCVQSEWEGVEYSSNFIFLLGNKRPNAVHVTYIARNIPVFIIYEVANEQLNSSILDTIQAVYALQNLQTRGTTDREVIHSAVEQVDNTLKKMNDAFKKKSVSSGLNKIHLNTVKSIVKKWEPIKKKYQDYLKTHNTELLQTIDSTIENIMSLLRSMYSSCMMDDAVVSLNHDVVLPVLNNVRKSLQDFTEMFQTKAHKNFSLGTKSTLSINKYLEEFPGLVHFLYIDRITHRFIAPSLDFSSMETTSLTKRKIWLMLEFARSHLKEGHMYLMWKDTVFNYSYFLWFEDVSGTPLKPKISPSAIIKTLPAPGLLAGDFYHQLIKKCFPTQSSQRIRCYELFSVHLGLATASCVLEQSRRLTATIWEVTGVPSNPLDML